MQVCPIVWIVALASLMQYIVDGVWDWRTFMTIAAVLDFPTVIKKVAIEEVNRARDPERIS